MSIPLAWIGVHICYLADTDYLHSYLALLQVLLQQLLMVLPHLLPSAPPLPHHLLATGSSLESPSAAVLHS
jgi:hypothetical protein